MITIDADILGSRDTLRKLEGFTTWPYDAINPIRHGCHPGSAGDLFELERVRSADRWLIRELPASWSPPFTEMRSLLADALLLEACAREWAVSLDVRGAVFDSLIGKLSRQQPTFADTSTPASTGRQSSRQAQRCFKIGRGRFDAISLSVSAIFPVPLLWARYEG